MCTFSTLAGIKNAYEKISFQKGSFIPLLMRYEARKRAEMTTFIWFPKWPVSFYNGTKSLGHDPELIGQMTK